MKILDLPLKKEWFDMIKNGNKREEYREIKPYWITRLFDIDKKTKQNEQVIIEEIKNNNIQPKDFTHVKFRKGYTNDYIIFRIENITIGYGNKEWGAPTNKEVFIIKLSQDNLKQQFNKAINKIVNDKENEYVIDNKVNIDKLTQLLTEEIRNVFDDDKMTFKSNNNIDDFVLNGVDEYTNKIMECLNFLT